MTDYWLNKLIFELQGPDGKDQWTNHRPEDYEIRIVTRDPHRTMKDDIGTLLPVNPYLMRFFLLMLGHDDDQSIAVLAEFKRTKIRAGKWLKSSAASQHHMHQTSRAHGTTCRMIRGSG